MEFKMWALAESGMSGQIKSKASVESDIIVSDKNPDIYKILCVKAVSDMSDYQLKKDKISYSGNVKFSVFYISEDERNKIYTMECTAPFSHIAEIDKHSDNLTMKSQCNVLKTVFDVKNSRKINVGAILDIRTDWINVQETNAIECEDIPSILSYKSEECSYDILKCSSEFELDISDTISLDIGDDAEIYDVQVNTDISEIKAVNNKAVIKGQANVTILYLSDDVLQGYNTEIPFTEIVDIDNLSSGQKLVSHFEIAKVDYDISQQAENMGLLIEIKLRGSIWGYENTNCRLITDMYSPDYAYNIELRKCNVNRIVSAKDTKVTLKNTFTINDSSKSISKVHYANCNAVVDNYNVAGEQLKICGNLESTVIYTDTNEGLCRVGEITPFETEIELVGADEKSKLMVDLSCINSGFVFTSSMEIQVRAVAKINVVAFNTVEQPIVSAFSVDMKSPIKKETQPGIVVYYPDASSTLWDIAKKYNTTCEDLIAVNSLDKENPITSGVPIIIPKRYTR